MEQIKEGIYEVKLPLKGSSLKELSSYIIKGDERSCVIDVGFADEESDWILNRAVDDLRLDRKKTDILLTHSHNDHCGNLIHMYQDFGVIYCSQWDSRKISASGKEKAMEEVRESMGKCGIPQLLLSQIDWEDFAEPGIPDDCIKMIKDGDILQYGTYRLKVMELKGHMPGQLGFYDEDMEILFPGDHVLNKITPNIGYYEEGEHSLADYIKNLKKVRNLKVKHVFPAHRGEIKHLKERVDNILEHHEERLDEITGVLYSKPMCAYEVAGKVKWYYKEGNFPAYPVMMKWMAASEILAHLEYLYQRGEILRSGEGKQAFIYKCKI